MWDTTIRIFHQVISIRPTRSGCACIVDPRDVYVSQYVFVYVTLCIRASAVASLWWNTGDNFTSDTLFN